MTLKMDTGIRHSHSHHRTALPKRTSPPDAKTAMRKASILSRKGEIARGNKGSTSPASSPAAAVAAAVCAGGGGGGAGAKGGGAGGGGTAKGANVARHGSKKSRIHASTGGDAGPRNGGERVGGHGGVVRKRVRVVDEKLGEFIVFLMRYDGDHNDVCERCDKGGDLLCCDFCNLVYHLPCVTPKLKELPPEELWLCPACTAEVTSRQVLKRRRVEDSGRTSPGPGSGRGQGQNQNLERLPSFHGVKPENEAFRAFVQHKKQTLDIGLFSTAQAAARAYDRKALSLFGDAAVCNFPADEQVEVEGVGADGNTVKGVVRSFHQWRAEMQWGNKKRHLGFFDRLDHAAFAYNRAALYMNGPETALNPTKEDYVPPPPTGAPVRVPRNKIFAQQLPLPLSARAQADGAVSAEQLRRRYQMQGKYHVPLVGEEHQVSYLPPLPPPSRPWSGLSALARSTTKSPEGCVFATPTDVSDARIVIRVKLPARPVVRMGDRTRTAVSMASPERESDANAGDRCIRQVVLHDADESSLSSRGTGCGSFSLTPPSRPPTGVYEAGLAEEKAARQGKDIASPTAAAMADSSLEWSSDLAQAVADSGFKGRAYANESVARIGKILPVTPEYGSPGKESTASRSETNHRSKVVQAALLKEKVALTPSRHEAKQKCTVRVARRVVLSCPKEKTPTISSPVSASCSVTGQSLNGGKGDKKAARVDSSVPCISPSAAGMGGSSQWNNDGAKPERRQARLELTSDTYSPCVQASLDQVDHPALVLKTGGFLSTPRKVASVKVADSTGVAPTAEGKISSNQSPQPTEYRGAVVLVRRKEQRFSTTPPCDCSDRETDEEDCGAGVSRRGVSTVVEVAPHTSDGPPLPNLAFEDVAELVWDPRSGPKPKGAGEGKTAEKAKMAVERVMWERDSTLLGRVAPQHTERAMQVLQTCRHDVERAAQILSVRHGIHVIGLSSVRKTRNSRAEQNAFEAEGAGGSGSDLNGASGGWSNGTYNAAAIPGSQHATAASSPRAVVRRADAQDVTRDEARLAGEAFMRHGRDLNAVAKALGWKRNRVVDYYYCIWKYSPAYQVWKATRHQAGLPGVGNGAVSGVPLSSSSLGGPVGGGLPKASSDGMRWRGSRLRTLKTSSS